MLGEDKKLYYSSSKNVKLCGILTKASEDNKIIVMCHGIRGTKEERGSFNYLAKKLQENGYNSFRFDFRAHGESSGNDYEMTIAKEIDDLKCTINMLQDKGFTEIILLGASFGAGIISLFPHNEFKCVKGLILWYGAIDYDYIKYGNLFSDDNRKIAEKQGYYISQSISTGKEFKFGLGLFDEIDKLKPYENLQNSQLPKLFVHGKVDNAVPYQLSEKIFTKCTNAQLELIENGNHTFDNSTKALQEAVDKTIEFVKKIL